MNDANEQIYDAGVEWTDRYFPADKVPFDPADEEVKYMLKIVAYDIANATRLKKVAKICELYGVRIEKSVFECDLTEELFETFWLELVDVIDEQEDSVIAYRINRADAKDIMSMGCVHRPRKKLCYICGCC